MSVKYEELIIHLKAHSQKGLEALYNLYGERLYSYATTKWNFKEDDSWEIIYKTFDNIIVSINRYNFENEKHFKNFLYKVFKNNLHELYRKKNKDEKIIILTSFQTDINVSDYNEINDDDNYSLQDEEKADSFLSQIDINKLIEEESIDNESSALDILNQALVKLDDDDRDILLLRAQNFSYNEISELLKQTESKNLKVKYHRARKKLLNFINELNTINHER